MAARGSARGGLRGREGQGSVAARRRFTVRPRACIACRARRSSAGDGGTDLGHGGLGRLAHCLASPRLAERIRLGSFEEERRHSTLATRWAGPAIAPSRPVAVSSSTLTQASRSRPSRDRGRTARAATGRRRPVPATRRCQGLAPGWPRSGPGPQSGGGSGRRHRLAGSPRPGGRGGAPGCIRPDDADKDVHGRSSRSTDRAVALWWELLLAGSFAHDELWEVRAVGAYRVLLVGLLRGWVGSTSSRRSSRACSSGGWGMTGGSWPLAGMSSRRARAWKISRPMGLAG